MKYTLQELIHMKGTPEPVRHALYTEVLEHLNGLEQSQAWTEAEKRREQAL